MAIIEIAAIVILLFGTKKLRNIGGDLGSAVKGFKKAMSEDEIAAEKKKDADFEQQNIEQKQEAQETPVDSKKDKEQA